MHKKLMQMEVHVYSSVIVKSQAGNMRQRYNNNTKRPKPTENQLGILKFIHFARKFSRGPASGPGESTAGVMYP